MTVYSLLMNTDRVQQTSGSMTRVWGVAELGGLELLQAQLVEHVFPPHAHSEYMINIIERGSATVSHPNGVSTLRAGLVGVAGPNEVRSISCNGTDPFTYRVFYIPSEVMSGFADEITDHLVGLSSQVLDDPYLYNLLYRAHMACAQPTSALERETLIAQALERLALRSCPNPWLGLTFKNTSKTAWECRAFLDCSFQEKLTLKDLEMVTDMSGFHLIRVFRRAFGLSPHQYQTQLRIKRARFLLQQGAEPVAVAGELGFHDQSHLSKQFKRYVGLNPSEYRTGMLSAN
jgi:AraC-like DNA-binding protein